MAKNNQSNKYVPKKQGGYIPPSNTNKKKSKFTLSQWIVFILMIFWTVCSCLSIYLSIRDLTTVSASTQDNKKVASTYANSTEESLGTFNFITVPLNFEVRATPSYGYVQDGLVKTWKPNFNLKATLYTFRIGFVGGVLVPSGCYCTFEDKLINGSTQVSLINSGSSIANKTVWLWNVANYERTVTYVNGRAISYLDYAPYLWSMWNNTNTLPNIQFNYNSTTQKAVGYIRFYEVNPINYSQTAPSLLTISGTRNNNSSFILRYFYHNILTDGTKIGFIIENFYEDYSSTEFSYDYYLSPVAFSDNTYYQQGYEQGYKQGYNDGDSQGLNTGYQNGYDRGYSDGKNVGYNQGVLESNDYSFLGLLGAVVDAPISVVSQWLNFDLLGFNMSNFFFAICTLALTIAIIRLIL